MIDSMALNAATSDDAVVVTAAVLVIGDEILSGRTKDKNIGYIAEFLTSIGIDLREVRIVPDEEPEIIAAVNALRTRYTYLFTTGGIGPTHDDITAECVAKAFGVALEHHPRAVEIMRERVAQTGGVMLPGVEQDRRQWLPERPNVCRRSDAGVYGLSSKRKRASRGPHPPK